MQSRFPGRSTAKFAVCVAVVTLALVANLMAGQKNVKLAVLDGSSAAGEVTIHSGNHNNYLSITVSGLAPNSVHSVWLLLDATAPPFVVDPVLGLSVVTDPSQGTLAPVFPASPAAADDAGFKDGMGLDPNGFVTDAKGTASFKIQMNYDITKPLSAPVVLAPFMEAVQVAPVSGPGQCQATPGSTFSAQVDSAYARIFDTSSATPNFQLLDGSYKAKLIRATVAGLIIVQHYDGITHGHAPGVRIEDSGCGDLVEKLLGTL